MAGCDLEAVSSEEEGMRCLVDIIIAFVYFFISSARNAYRIFTMMSEVWSTISSVANELGVFFTGGRFASNSIIRGSKRALKIW